VRVKTKYFIFMLPLVLAFRPAFVTPVEDTPMPVTSQMETELVPVVGDVPVAAGTVGGTVSGEAKGGAGLTASKSKAWAQISAGSRILTNNVWGAPAGEEVVSDVYAEPGGSFGWTWNRQSPKAKPGASRPEPIYPNVRIGGTPWAKSNCRYFPLKVGETKSLDLSVSYDYPKVPTGSFNLAYDIFFSDTNQPAAKPLIKAEVMIWIHGTAKQPPNTYKGDFSDGRNTYALHSWVMQNGRLYYSFIMKGDPQYKSDHTVDAVKLIDNLKLDPSLYIHGVELGSEVCGGAGKIEITKLSVNVNGQEA